MKVRFKNCRVVAPYIHGHVDGELEIISIRIIIFILFLLIDAPRRVTASYRNLRYTESRINFVSNDEANFLSSVDFFKGCFRWWDCAKIVGRMRCKRRSCGRGSFRLQCLRLFGASEIYKWRPLWSRGEGRAVIGGKLVATYNSLSSLSNTLYIPTYASISIWPML